MSDATLLEALNRHRGKGQQKVTVEHVHVHSGGQGVVGASGAEITAILWNKPMQSRLPMHQPAMRRADAERDAVPVAGDAERPLPVHGGKSPGAPSGNGNALKHGQCSAEAIARRAEIATLLRRMKATAKDKSTNIAATSMSSRRQLGHRDLSVAVALRLRTLGSLLSKS